MNTTDTLPRDAQSILELAARSMFDLFANASEGMMLVDRARAERAGGRPPANYRVLFRELARLIDADRRSDDAERAAGSVDSDDSAKSAG